MSRNMIRKIACVAIGSVAMFAVAAAPLGCACKGCFTSAKGCPAGCTKPCCKKASAEGCKAGCTKPCCKKA